MSPSPPRRPTVVCPAQTRLWYVWFWIRQIGLDRFFVHSSDQSSGTIVFHSLGIGMVDCLLGASSRLAPPRLALPRPALPRLASPGPASPRRPSRSARGMSRFLALQMEHILRVENLDIPRAERGSATRSGAWRRGGAGRGGAGRGSGSGANVLGHEILVFDPQGTQGNLPGHLVESTNKGNPV